MSDLFESLFPGLSKKANPTSPSYIPAMNKGRVGYASPDEVEYEILSPNHIYTDSINLAPMFSTMKGTRAFMAGKYFSVVGDSVVLVKRANGKIYHGPINEYAFMEGDTSPSIDENKQIIWRKVDGLSRHLFGEELYEVELHSGRKFTVTKHHSCVTIGDDGSLVEVFPENLKKYDPIPRAREIPITSEFSEFYVPDGNKHNACSSHTFKLNFDFGWFIGIYLAEGCTVSQGRKEKSPSVVNIAACVPEIRNKVLSIFEETDATAKELYSKAHGKIIGVGIYWKQLAQKLVEEFGTGSAAKEIPGWVFFAPKEFRQGIVAGYLDGDGGFSLHREQLAIQAVSKSKNLIDGLSMLLSTLSIDSCLKKNISNSPFAKNGKEFYRLSILAEDYDKITGLVYPRKKQMLEDFQKSGARERSWIPAYKTLKEKARKLLTKEHKKLRTAIQQDQLTIGKVIAIFGDSAKQECPWVDSNVRWDYVKSVTQLLPTDKYVYDIHMSDNVFMVNGGVFVHNTQALPMTEPESPLVMSLDEDSEDDSPLEVTLGKKLGVLSAPSDGIVKKVDKDRIILQTPDNKTTEVELRNYYPHNRKTFTTDFPMVKPGDQVKAGQALAHSNYVTPQGELALGKNLKVAFMPGKTGGTFEDSITISEGAAKKLTSSHLYGFDVENKQGTVSSKTKFMQLFPNKYTKEQLDKIDDNGMIKSGVELNPGDPVFLSLAPRTLRPEDRAKGNLHKILRKSFIDKSQTWEKGVNGKVVDAVETRNGLSVNIAANFPVKPGDKLSSRFAAKGVVGRIIPDDKMFKDQDGNTVDILINPAAMIGRVNPGMVYEALLGKVASKTGKKYVLPSFSNDSYHEFVKRELETNQISDAEDLFDPENNRTVPRVLTGIQNFLKLEHTADAKLSAIDEGNPDQNEQPGKPGGSESAKRVGLLDTMALLSHGAVKNLSDIQNYRTGANVDMWRAIRLGQPLPAPKIPFIYEKFTNTLKAAGINPEKRGPNITIKALKRADIEQLVGDREVQNSDTINIKDNQPVSGGLLDQGLHGIDGKRWSFVKLDEPMPNPILEESLRKVLNLTEPKMRDILAGKEMLEGRTGPKALMDAFSSLDLDKLEEDLRSKVRNGSKTARNDAVKRINIIAGIKKQGLSADDFFMEKVPVLPASYRPVSMMGKVMLSADANYLYKDLMTARDLHRQSLKEFGDSEAGDERLAVYDSLTAVMGLGEPLHPKLQQKGVKGFIKSLSGSGGPKTGMFLSKVIGHTVNTVGRGVAIPSDELDMDSVGLPLKMAWKLYSPFVMRRMVKNGMQASQAAQNIERKTDYAKRFLLEEMGNRPVMYNRAPALHRYNIMSAMPKVVTGDSIQVSPLIVKGFNLDFDGDQINIHVPVSDDAVEEAKEKLLPSKNLLSIKDRKVFYTPSQEFVLGLYNTTGIDKRRPTTKYKDASEVIAAYRRGEISIDSPVEVSA